MKVIKVYQKECTGCGRYKQEMAALKSYAAAHDSVVQVIRTPLSQKLYEEAAAYDLPQPFVVIEDKAYPLGELPKQKRGKTHKVPASEVVSEEELKDLGVKQEDIDKAVAEGEELGESVEIIDDKEASE